jgi:hypothetical protein
VPLALDHERMATWVELDRHVRRQHLEPAIDRHLRVGRKHREGDLRQRRDHRFAERGRPRAGLGIACDFRRAQVPVHRRDALARAPEPLERGRNVEEGARALDDRGRLFEGSERLGPPLGARE